MIEFSKYLSIVAVTWMVAASVAACGGRRAEELPAITSSAQPERIQEEEAPKKSGEMTVGSWEGKTFTNTWLNLSIQFPEESTILSEKELQTLVGFSQDILINSGNYNKEQINAGKYMTVYDFMVRLPDQISNIQLIYENTENPKSGPGTSSEEYLDMVKEQLSKLKDYDYEFGDYEILDLGGQAFVKMPATLLDGTRYQDYYSMSKGDYVATLLASYTSESAELVNQIIVGMKAAEQHTIK